MRRLRLGNVAAIFVPRKHYPLRGRRLFLRVYGETSGGHMTWLQLGPVELRIDHKP